MIVIRALLYAALVRIGRREPGSPMPSAVYANEDVDPTKTIGIAVVPAGDRPPRYLPTFALDTEDITLLHPTKEGA